MPCLRSFRVSYVSSLSPHRPIQVATLLTVLVAGAATAYAQDRSQPSDQPQPSSSRFAGDEDGDIVTLPAGTHLALVLTHPVESRVIHRGDDIYAQVTFPVASANQVVIPAGTFVEGTVDKLQQKNGRGELRLQTLAITFPDGYVTPVEGPITLESNPGYAVRDPGPGRTAGALALMAGTAGIGALLGHAAGAASSTTTTSFPPGCTGAPPFCTPTSTTSAGTKGRDAIVGAGVGVVVGGFTSMALLLGTHHFFMDAGSPVETTLGRAVTLRRAEVAKAVRQTAEHPIAEQPVMPRPVPPPPPDIPSPLPPSPAPATPTIVLPGTPGPGGVPGPPIIIPGTPPGTV